jgi:hypothetical protein
MTAAFTQGPLTTELPDTIPNAINVVAADLTLNSGMVVARCFGPDRKSNARLIAAAPELLEALIDLHAVAYVTSDEHYEPIARAAAAIAKATGAAQ